MGASSCFIPYDSPLDSVHLVVSATGETIPQAPGLSGGYPAATQWDVLIRNATVREQFTAGRIPRGLDELGGQAHELPTHLETDLAAGDVYFTHWQGGGGMGDPVLREPNLVALDVRLKKISYAGAADVYGVLLDDKDEADLVATATHRKDLRRRRAGLDPETRAFELEEHTEGAIP